mmetsp:Transcript_80496/g.176500  ORF Transcript_80496/g.176500 Transcript_80496/m.176500 type:complete len:221 (-) Transcript_80496:1172-1834(-)
MVIRGRVIDDMYESPNASIRAGAALLKDGPEAFPADRKRNDVFFAAMFYITVSICPLTFLLTDRPTDRPGSAHGLHESRRPRPRGCCKYFGHPRYHVLADVQNDAHLPRVRQPLADTGPPDHDGGCPSPDEPHHRGHHVRCLWSHYCHLHDVVLEGPDSLHSDRCRDDCPCHPALHCHHGHHCVRRYSWDGLVHPRRLSDFRSLRDDVRQCEGSGAFLLE